MRTETKITYTILILLLLNISINIAYAQTVNSQGSFEVLFPTTSGLEFQNFIDKTLTLQVTNGILNSSNCGLSMDQGGGQFVFTALKDCKIKIDFNVPNVYVSGDQNKESRGIVTGETITVDTGNIVTIGWSIPFEPLLPILFILGMVGLAGMFSGPLYGIHLIKKGEYREGFVNAVLITTIGIGFVLAWLWS